MARTKFSAANYSVRLVSAIVLVLSTYNPIEPFSYYYWAIHPLFSSLDSFSLFKGFAGIVLLIGWTIFIRSTMRSLGLFGILLAVSFFGLLIWLVVDRGWVPIENRTAVTWLILFGLSGVLSAGISWSHIRRRMTGQLDVDETDP